MELISRETWEYDVTDEAQCAMGQDPDEVARVLAAKLAAQGWDEKALSGQASQALRGQWWVAPRTVLLQMWPFR